ncbi:MAG: uracil-DNA glycosylase family protein, partial [Bacteroidota bacterium]
RCLFLLEAPGRMAVVSGFISRDNDDQTAENFSAEVKDLARKKTVLWNIVPWYIRKKPNGEIPQEDIDEGTKYLKRLLRLKDLRRHLRIIVLVGEKAQRVEDFLRENLRSSKIEVVKMPHPSPQNRAPEKEKKIRDALNNVVRILKR